MFPLHPMPALGHHHQARLWNLAHQDHAGIERDDAILAAPDDQGFVFQPRQARITVNRRSNGTPYRRVKGTPFVNSAMVVERGPCAARGAGRA
jgi:hypothetical protein